MEKGRKEMEERKEERKKVRIGKEEKGMKEKIKGRERRKIRTLREEKG